MNDTAQNQGGGTPAARSTRDVLSDAEWKRIHDAAVRAERDPDPAQTSWLPDPALEGSDD